MLKKNMISRKAAAELLGCSIQTVSNMATRGLISKVSFLGADGKMYDRFNRKEILKRKGDLVEVVAGEADINSLKEEIRYIREELREKAAAGRRAIERETGGPAIFRRYVNMVSIGLGAVIGEAGGLNGTQKKILRGLLDFRSAEDLAEETGLTVRGVRQTIIRASRKLVSLKGEVEKARRANEKIEELEGLCKGLRVENDALYRLLRERGYETPVDGELSSIMKKNIRNLGISVRLYNCLKGCYIDTLYDIVGHNRKEFLKVRGLGKVSLRELDNLLKRNGLDYSMHKNHRFPWQS